MSEVLVKRSDKVAFFGVMDNTVETFHRMRGFTDLGTSKNPKEYTRQYVDEDSERADVIAFSPSMSYGFDQFLDNPVHDDIVAMTDADTLGTAAVRNIIIVDMNDRTGTEPDFVYAAKKRPFTVIPDSEGTSTDAYTYSGTFKANGDTVTGTVTIDTATNVATFTADA